MTHRTTLTLDDDVAARIDDEIRRTGRPYRAVVNDALRRGLDAPAPDLPAFAIRARPMRLRTGVPVDSVSGLLDLLDGPGGR